MFFSYFKSGSKAGKHVPESTTNRRSPAFPAHRGRAGHTQEAENIERTGKRAWEVPAASNGRPVARVVGEGLPRTASDGRPVAHVVGERFRERERERYLCDRGRGQVGLCMCGLWKASGWIEWEIGRAHIRGRCEERTRQVAS